MSHHSKDSQKKRWACHFSWTNPTNRKYLIAEIYDCPKPLEDGRKANGGNCTSKYQALDDIIMDYMIDKNDVTGTISQILVDIGLVSKKYHNNRREQQDYPFRKTRLSKGVINHVFWQMNLVINSAKSSLERLEKSNNLYVIKTNVLVTPGPYKRYINLDPSQTEMVVKIREDIYKQVKSERHEIFSYESQKIINERLSDELTKFWGEKIAYTYTEYTLTASEKEYMRKTNQTINDLTRKYAWTICQKIYQIEFEDFYKQDSTMEQVIMLLNDLFPHMTLENWERLLQEPDVKEFGNGVLLSAYQMEHPPIEVEYWGEGGSLDDLEDDEDTAW